MTHLSGNVIPAGASKNWAGVFFILQLYISVEFFRQMIQLRGHTPEFNTEGHGTDLQIDLQALVIDFCLECDEMELLCDDQWGLQGAHYATFMI